MKSARLAQKTMPQITSAAKDYYSKLDDESKEKYKLW